MDFYREQASNRHIIDVFDWKLEGNAPYLIIPYSPLGSLQQFVPNRQNWKRVAQWFCDIAIGLTPIYQTGGFHGDPKPSNFLLFPDGRGKEFVVIIDFGLGQRPNPASGPMTRSPRGTPEYMDPDLSNGGPYTWRHDIFAMGKSLRELLTGSREKLLFTPVPGPAALGQLIDKMTDPNPQQRPMLQDIYQTLQNLLYPPVQVTAPAQQGIGGGWLLAGLGALLAYATSNTYDPKADRFRDSNGRFRGGRWG